MSKDVSEVMRGLYRESLGGGENVIVEYPKKRPPFEPHKENDDMQEIEEIETKKSRRDLAEKPVENDGPVPLMPNLDANARHVITSIRVHKRTPPGDGIKGDVPESTTVDFIARRWGDGIYDFEALNEAQQVLRRNTNVKIAMGYQTMDSGSLGSQLSGKLIAPIPAADGMADKLLERLDAVSDRAQKASESALQSTQKLSADYASMLREDSKDRSEKDRAYHKAQSEQQTNFFQAMISNMQAMHEQSMERSREQFQQTMQMMQFSHQQTLTQNNPALLFQLFERGLKYGAEANSEGEESPLSAILGGLTHGLGTVRDMMMLQNPQPSAMLPVSNPSQPSKDPKLPTSKSTKKRVISNAELVEVVRLKKLAESKGYDFGGLVKQAQAMVSNAPANEPLEDEEEIEDEDGTTSESDISETGQSDMD